MMTTKDTELIEKAEYDALLYQIRLGYSYHRRREWFLNLLDKSTAAIAVIGTSSVLASFSDSSGYVDKIIQFFIVVLSTISLVFGFSNQSKRHSELAATYAGLERRFHSNSFVNFDRKAFKEINDALLETEATEPPTYSGLIQLIQDEADVAKGRYVEAERLSLSRKFKAHFGFGYIPHLDQKSSNEDNSPQ